MIYFNPLRYEADFSFWYFEKIKENEKNLLTFFAGCDKVNEVLVRQHITKSHLKSLKKLKKVLDKRK